MPESRFEFWGLHFFKARSRKYQPTPMHSSGKTNFWGLPLVPLALDCLVVALIICTVPWSIKCWGLSVIRCYPLRLEQKSDCLGRHLRQSRCLLIQESSETMVEVSSIDFRCLFALKMKHLITHLWLKVFTPFNYE